MTRLLCLGFLLLAIGLIAGCSGAPDGPPKETISAPKEGPSATGGAGVPTPPRPPPPPPKQ